MFQYPNLSKLPCRVRSSWDTPSSACRAAWWRLCANRVGETAQIPSFGLYADYETRRGFHALAKVSDGHPHRTRLYDAHEDAYMTPYAEQDVAYILSLGYESIEHIVPRSYYAGESAAQNDPFGWVVAASYKNSLRKNLPLVLWTSEGVGDNMYAELMIGDERHFVPPVNQRARLARKWLYMRATYVATVPPSQAQQQHLTDILDHVERYPPDLAERRMNELLAHKYGGWDNPFISQPTEALRVARTSGWQRLVFGTAL